MADTVWVEALDGELINLNQIGFIKYIIHSDRVELIACFTADISPIPLANVSSVAVAKRFLRIMGTLIKSNVKCISTQIIATQAESERE